MEGAVAQCRAAQGGAPHLRRCRPPKPDPTALYLFFKDFLNFISNLCGTSYNGTDPYQATPIVHGRDEAAPRGGDDDLEEDCQWHIPSFCFRAVCDRRHLSF